MERSKALTIFNNVVEGLLAILVIVFLGILFSELIWPPIQ